MYDTDLTNDQWLLVKSFIPPPKTGGRPRTTDERAALNAIMYWVKTGVHWRSLPHNFPPWQTVYRYFRLLNKSGAWRKLQQDLNIKTRLMEGKMPNPSAIIIDSQSVKTGKMVAVKSRGFDGGKRVKGRKRHMVVDTLGLIVDVSVTPANVHDTKGAQKVLAKIAKRKKSANKIKTIFADKGYNGANLANWVKANLKNAAMSIGENMTRAGGKFIPAKKRWVVERGFAWMSDYYRLSVDRERLLVTSLAAVRIAYIRLMLRRLCPPDLPSW